MGAAPDDRAKIYVDYETPKERIKLRSIWIMGRHTGAAPDARAQIYVDYVEDTIWGLRQTM